MNFGKLNAQWTQLKGDVQERWGELTNDDITAINGEYNQLVGKIQERYNIAKEEAAEQVREWLEKNPEMTPNA